jgi:asparagine synthase (glutamine-hydrolysing)
VSLDPIERYIDSISLFTDLNKLSLYTNEFKQTLNNESLGAKLFRDFASSVETGDAIDPLLYLDSKTYLPGDILTKVDRMSMAVSLETRVPLLDHKLIEFVTRIPSSMKMKGLETKHIFKRAVRGLVPDEILERPKQGFGVPLQEWINLQLRGRIHDTLTERRTHERGLFNSQAVNILLGEHERGRRDHSPALWALLMLELWHRAFVDHVPGSTRNSNSATLITVGV